MNHTNVQKWLDRMAISVSALCMLHCLATPILLVTVPILSSTIMADEEFHHFMVIFVLPVSIIALFIGCRHHKDRTVLLLGGIGLLSLVLVAYFGHDLLGEMGENVGAVTSGIILAIGHLRNYRLCRHGHCDS